MSSNFNRPTPLQGNESLTKWLKRLIISLTLLIWVALIAVGLQVVGQVSRAVILLAIGATIATVVYPLIKWLERKIPRPLAIGIVYIIVFGALGALLYLLVNLIIDQLLSLIQYIQSLVNSNGNSQTQPILDMFHRFGISQSQLQSFGQHLIAQLQGLVNNAIPFVSNIFNVVLNMILVALLSIYFLLTCN